MMLRSSLLAVLVCALALATSARTAVAQGATAPLGIDASRLQMGTDSLAIFLIRGADTVRTGTVRDELSVVGTGANARLQRVYRSEDQILGLRLDTIVDLFPSLAPRLQHSRSTRSAAEFLDYQPGLVRGSLRLSNGDSVAVDVSLPPLVYGAASFDLVLRAAPLSAEWQAAIPSFLSSSRTVTSLRARVAASGRIDDEDCWRIDADFAGTAVSFWVGKASRRLRQQVMHIQPGVQLLFTTFPAQRPSARPAAERAPRGLAVVRPVSIHSRTREPTMRTILLPVLILALAACTSGDSSDAAPSADPATDAGAETTGAPAALPDSAVRHVVVFKYRPEATEAQIAEVTTAFRALKDRIPGVIAFEHGVNNSPEGKNLGFTHAYTLAFENAAARDAYLPHPEHQAFGQLLDRLGVLEDAFVVDYVPAP